MLNEEKSNLESKIENTEIETISEETNSEIESKEEIVVDKIDKENQEVQKNDVDLNDQKVEQKESSNNNSEKFSKNNKRNDFNREIKKDNGELLIYKTKLLECGVQYGHQVQWWNPKMKPFINFKKNGIHIINLHKTIVGLQNSFNAIQKLSENGRKILLVGTTRYSKETIKLNAERVDAFYVNNRWLGGLLTNFKTIKNSISRLKHLEKLSKSNFEGYTKKEGLLLQKELSKLNDNLGGIKNMRKLPDAIFVSSVKADKIAIQEAKKLGIPVFGIIDTNVDPNSVEFPIPANDDALKSVSLIVTLITDAIAKAQGKPMIAAYKPSTEVKILGIDENYEKPLNNNRFYDKSNSRNNYNKNPRTFNRDFNNNNNNNFNRERTENKSETTTIIKNDNNLKSE